MSRSYSGLLCVIVVISFLVILPDINIQSSTSQDMIYSDQVGAISVLFYNGTMFDKSYINIDSETFSIFTITPRIYSGEAIIFGSNIIYNFERINNIYIKVKYNNKTFDLNISGTFNTNVMCFVIEYYDNVSSVFIYTSNFNRKNIELSLSSVTYAVVNGIYKNNYTSFYYSRLYSFEESNFFLYNNSTLLSEAYGKSTFLIVGQTKEISDRYLLSTKNNSIGFRIMVNSIMDITYNKSLFTLSIIKNNDTSIDFINDTKKNENYKDWMIWWLLVYLILSK